MMGVNTASVAERTRRRQHLCVADYLDKTTRIRGVDVAAAAAQPLRA
jgi:hypothetical protein